MHWMTRAGPTAFRMKPVAKAKVAGMPNNLMARPPSKKASMMPGTSSSLVATQPTLLKICVAQHSWLHADDHRMGILGCNCDALKQIVAFLGYAEGYAFVLHAFTSVPSS